MQMGTVGMTLSLDQYAGGLQSTWSSTLSLWGKDRPSKPPHHSKTPDSFTAKFQLGHDAISDLDRILANFRTDTRNKYLSICNTVDRDIDGYFVFHTYLLIAMLPYPPPSSWQIRTIFYLDNNSAYVDKSPLMVKNEMTMFLTYMPRSMVSIVSASTWTASFTL